MAPKHDDPAISRRTYAESGFGTPSGKCEFRAEDLVAQGVDGDSVRVFNERGRIQIRVRVDDRVRPAVVSLPHGWWVRFMGGASTSNALTPDGLSDRGGGGDFHGARVEVEKVG